MKVRLVGDIESNHSLSIINRYIYNYLKTKIEHIEQSNSVKTTNICDVEIRHTYPPCWYPSKSRFLIYIQEWEFTRVPLEWVINFNKLACCLIVPSEFTKEVYLYAGITIPIYVIPNGYNSKIFYPIQNTNKSYTFLYIGNDQYRKGMDILYNIWDNHFKNNEDINLIIKDCQYIYGSKHKYDWSVFTNVEYIVDDLKEKELAKLYQKSNCYLCLSRGESFCLPIAESAGCNIDILCPDFGPYKEIVSNVDFIKTHKVKVDPQEKFIGKPGDAFSNMGSHFYVFEPDKEDIINKMNYKIKVKRKTNYKKNIFTVEEVSKKYLDIIKQYV